MNYLSENQNDFVKPHQITSERNDIKIKTL